MSASDTAAPQLAEGTILYAALDKDRPAIVVRMTNQGYPQIYWGRGRDFPNMKTRVMVEPNTRSGMKLRLSKPTFFYPDCWALLRRQDQIVKVLGLDPDLLINVRKMTIAATGVAPPKQTAAAAPSPATSSSSVAASAPIDSALAAHAVSLETATLPPKTKSAPPPGDSGTGAV